MPLQLKRVTSPMSFGEYFSRTAEQGDIDAQYNLANRYRVGYGVPQDYGQALKWNKKAGEGGHVHAQFNVGQIYEKGYTVPQDLSEAVKWYSKAAEQGS